ncbi:XapX domain-containing protein [Castellaniella sp.]|uniref:XapX domain-containing protein n=1 Tax=Castellaniella sp. TaxID=1955812 RepID=UPI002AFE252B|nr:XapX domain-containing protein [Castellaniella sp.]
MKLYIFSIAAGVLVGVIYSLLSVRSPAPPLVALLGLLGMLIGEQLIPVSKQILEGTAFTTACAKTQATEHVLGQLPGRNQVRKDTA